LKVINVKHGKKGGTKMKRRFFRVLPLAVAVLLATSCSKDEKNDNEVVNNGTEVVTPENTVKTVPFTLKVKTAKISKVAYSDAGGSGDVTPSFSEQDVTDKLAMTIKEGTNELGQLPLQNIDGTFSGNITKPSSETATLIGTITIAGTKTSSTTSLVDLMENCGHVYTTAEFSYNTTDKVSLTDDKSYIEFTLAEGQKQVSVNGTWYDVNQTSHKAWVAVEGGTTVTTRIKGSKDVTAGVIYTITCEDYVDLGLKFNVLWKTENEIGSSISKEIEGTTYYVFPFSSNTNIPSQDDFQSLIDNTIYTFDKSTYGKKGATFTTEQGTLFFPAAGYGENFQDDGTTCCYWSRTINTNPTKTDQAYVFNANETEGTSIRSMWQGWEHSVRLVRSISQ
jgi:hypothetical protein